MISRNDCVECLHRFSPPLIFSASFFSADVVGRFHLNLPLPLSASRKGGPSASCWIAEGSTRDRR